MAVANVNHPHETSTKNRERRIAVLSHFFHKCVDGVNLEAAEPERSVYGLHDPEKIPFSRKTTQFVRGSWVRQEDVRER